MKRVMTLGVGCLLLVASATAAQADTHSLISVLDCDQATTSGVGCSGDGSASITYDDATNRLDWTIEWSGLSGSVTNMHFHGPAAPGVTAGVTQGITDQTTPSVGTATVDEADEADLLGGLWYINIHTTTFGGGEIRGQVVTRPAVPATTVWSVIGLVLLMAGATYVLLRRRRAAQPA